MMGRTHLAIGALSAALLLPFSPSALLPAALVLIGALLPDVDHEGSTINKWLPVTRWIPAFFEHRGFFHSLYPPAAIAAFGMTTGYWHQGLAITGGYLTHLISDAVTQAGIRPFHPLHRAAWKGPLRTGSTAETIVLIVVIAAIAWMGWKAVF